MDHDGNDPQDLHSALELRDRQIGAVHKITRLLSSTLDLDDRLRDILTVSMQVVDSVAGTIFLHRPNDDKLVFQYVVGEKAAELTGRAIDASVGVSGAVFQTGEAQITNRPREDSHFNPTVGAAVGFQTESILTVPLKYQEGVPVGVMQVLNKRTGEFTSSDLQVLEIVASIAATAIENAQLHREAQAAAVAHAVGDLSHDIKNKVTPISLAANTLKPTIEMALQDLDNTCADAPMEVVERVNDAVKWLREDYVEQFDIILDQVQKVQDYTKMIADALKGSISTPQLELSDPEPVIESQVKELESIARSRGVELVRSYDDVPRCRVDRNYLERAVFNLINNAIPETPAGGTITIRLGAQGTGTFPDGKYLLIEVQDTGCGMPANVMERILRGDAKSTKPGGTGLGTKIVHNAVTAHHGVFEGESRENAGTTFRMKLPLMTE
jgi:signal transduction histidine kinase